MSSTKCGLNRKRLDTGTNHYSYLTNRRRGPSRLQDRKERTHESLRGRLFIYQTQIQREEEQKHAEELSYGLQKTPRRQSYHKATKRALHPTMNRKKLHLAIGFQFRRTHRQRKTGTTRLEVLQESEETEIEVRASQDGVLSFPAISPAEREPTRGRKR